MWGNGALITGRHHVRLFTSLLQMKAEISKQFVETCEETTIEMRCSGNFEINYRHLAL